MPSRHSAQNTNSRDVPFNGFALPTSNTTYTPNQFFDVCLPHYSRGCVRLVAFLIRETLGWCDEDGDPQTSRHILSWDDFERAGISRDMIRRSLKEAISGHFIDCIREPRQQKAGQSAVSGLYELKWDERPTYVKNPREFRGFFAGDGNRTYIPNQFFDYVIPHETLAVTKVVGSIIRFSIGFQNKFGHRRQQISLSYQHIQNYCRVGNRNTLSGAIKRALESNFIHRLEEGYFDPDAGKLSKAAVYCLKWLNRGPDLLNGQKNVPENADPKKQSEKSTGNGPKNVPEERSEIRTDIEIKQRNKILKQKALSPEAAVSFEKLKEAGFDDRAAKVIACGHSFDCVDRQIRWIDSRGVRRNRLGMLRRAIEEDWPRPESATLARSELGQPNISTASGTFEQVVRNIERRFTDSSPTS